MKNLRPAHAPAAGLPEDYLPLGLVGLVGVVGVEGRLGDDLSVDPSLFCPLAPPLGVCIEELPPAADDGLFDVLLVLPAPDCSRWQPESARARDAATIISTFMDPP